jgi:uncharacterized glyoxalase superfamily protein PhnB
VGVQPIPEGYRTVTPYLIAAGADRLLGFATKGLGAKERSRMDLPDGKIGHAEIEIGDSIVMLAEATDEWKPAPSTIHLYVEDCDAVYRQAIGAGGDSVQEPTDQFYGDRMASVRDPVGNTWWIATHIEDVSEEEMLRRAAEYGSSAQ